MSNSNVKSLILKHTEILIDTLGFLRRSTFLQITKPNFSHHLCFFLSASSSPSRIVSRQHSLFTSAENHEETKVKEEGPCRGRGNATTIRSRRYFTLPGVLVFFQKPRI
ncbi:hypothetical protein YC2023_071439 [Brassica napus]